MSVQGSTYSTPEIRWGEIAPCEHLLQIYESDDAFVKTLGEFVAAGLSIGESTVVIATEAHREALERRLIARGFDVQDALDNGDLIVLDAAETLDSFIEAGWPDDDKFHTMIGEILDRARSRSENVRAFGEMVAILWGRGHIAATVRLENMWEKLCRERSFSLFCAYPKSCFNDNALKSLDDIHSLHSATVG